MLLGILQFVSVMLAATVMGMFLGPWAALTRTVDRLEPVSFVPVLHQLSPNMAQVMTILMPVSLVALLPLIFLTVGQGLLFYAYLTSFVLFLISLVVTIAIEVPLVRQMEKWDASAMPPTWRRVRDRWMSFHLVRISCGLIGLGLLVAVLTIG